MQFKIIPVTFVVLYLARNVLCQNATVDIDDVITDVPILDDVCPDIRDANVALGGPHCCNSTYSSFRRRYNVAYLKLTSFLEKLRAWDCPQFESECENRYFDFNRFTSLVYDRFCNETLFDENCREELEDITTVYGLNREGEISNATFYGEVILRSPCLQVQAYQYGEPYFEVSRPLFAFCGTVWCGFNENTLAYHTPSTWLCLPSSCRAGLIIVIVVCGILAVAVTMANLTVLIVISRNPRCPTSQMVYKLSLAVADLFVGVFVYPSFANTLYTFHVGPYKRNTLDESEMLSLEANFSTNLTMSLEEFDQDVNINYRPAITNEYRFFFGFVTSISLMVSVFTLMFASYDRFRAISAPMTYDKSAATSNSKRATIALWIVAIVIGLLPLIFGGISYITLAGGILLAVAGEISQIIHGIALGVPFLVVWVLTATIHFLVKRQGKYRRKLMSRRQNQDSKTERRLSKTLGIMVGVFTACILPAIIFAVIPESIASLNAENVRSLTKEPASAFITMEVVTVIILASNSLWNAFIYSFRNKEFRKDAAALHFKILSALGLVALKRVLGECLTKTAHDGRRRISSVFTATSDLRKNSTTSSTAEATMSSVSDFQSTSKTRDPISSSADGLNSYV